MKVVSSMIMLCVCVGSAQAAGLLAKDFLQARQPSAADMARFDAEGPQQMAAAKAAGNCKMLVNPLNIFRCQEELENAAHGVIGKAMAANQCGSLSKVEDVTACLQLQEGAALAKHATALVEQPTPPQIFQMRCNPRPQGGILSQVKDITTCTQLMKAKDIVISAGPAALARHGAMLFGCSQHLKCSGNADLDLKFR